MRSLHWPWDGTDEAGKLVSDGADSGLVQAMPVGYAAWPKRSVAGSRWTPHRLNWLSRAHFWASWQPAVIFSDWTHRQPQDLQPCRDSCYCPAHINALKNPQGQPVVQDALN